MWECGGSGSDGGGSGAGGFIHGCVFCDVTHSRDVKICRPVLGQRGGGRRQGAVVTLEPFAEGRTKFLKGHMVWSDKAICCSASRRRKVEGVGQWRC